MSEVWLLYYIATVRVSVSLSVGIYRKYHNLMVVFACVHPQCCRPSLQDQRYEYFMAQVVQYIHTVIIICMYLCVCVCTCIARSVTDLTFIGCKPHIRYICGNCTGRMLRIYTLQTKSLHREVCHIPYFLD